MISDLYNLGAGYNPLNAAGTFEITAIDAWNESSLDNFTVTFDGVNYSTTNGTVDTGQEENASRTCNLTFYTPHHQVRSY